jgi:hypothetical protein
MTAVFELSMSIVVSSAIAEILARIREGAGARVHPGPTSWCSTNRTPARTLRDATASEWSKCITISAIMAHEATTSGGNRTAIADVAYDVTHRGKTDFW